jgi:hypothetical protein
LLILLYKDGGVRHAASLAEFDDANERKSRSTRIWVIPLIVGSKRKERLQRRDAKTPRKTI